MENIPFYVKTLGFKETVEYRVGTSGQKDVIIAVIHDEIATRQCDADIAVLFTETVFDGCDSSSTGTGTACEAADSRARPAARR